MIEKVALCEEKWRAYRRAHGSLYRAVIVEVML